MVGSWEWEIDTLTIFLPNSHYSILVNWKSQFVIFGVSSVFPHFYFILNRNSCKQTVLKRCLILVYTDYVGPIYRLKTLYRE